MISLTATKLRRKAVLMTTKTASETPLLRGASCMKGSHYCLKKATYPTSRLKMSQKVSQTLLVSGCFQGLF